MQNWKALTFAAAALLALTTVAVLADGSEEVTDWWTQMKDHHNAVHGDDFDTHHQGMHGDNWQEHVTSCHGDTDNKDFEDMGTGADTMMGTA